MLPSLDDTTNAAADHRLRDEREIWITTVRSDGQPQSSLVGFLWDGTSFLILTSPESQKIRNLRANPRVSLHLDVGGESSEDVGILTLEGTAAVDSVPLSDDEATTYVNRHQEAIRQAGLTPEEALAELSAVIRVTPSRTRAY
ncbi:pyridoxamine 5'-phosphate oxidase family protein [Phytoactinopolyspora halotolerans]|uniref:TIGR03667 family PPOX class F420-dependent oxidoreductase n=1 Tax=Phytoactinopolyspora halotolerans TaxID=1981512 RepID=A0A6L9SJB2_9ACTN|nr:pyridoxamine 5'-phosphate oxidase family protein [Phytoactinopolyspora halotolerans]NEE04381.1 TIGR03667 family PPOX class F420-dependent oxidoreductase [Phytoactinopolyspora halotolerans]